VISVRQADLASDSDGHDRDPARREPLVHGGGEFPFEVLNRRVDAARRDGHVAVVVAVAVSDG
jgi:hypothetical protein